MSRPGGLTRRQFVGGTGTAGLTLVVALSPRVASARAAARALAPNPWLTITPDGSVTVHSTKAEMGQGIATALAQIVAEELEVNWKDVRVDFPTNDPRYGRIFTSGSLSVILSFDTLARAGAAARIMLIDAAAQIWAVDVADCLAQRGTIRHRQTGRTLSYAELVRRVPITRSFTPDELKAIVLKKPPEYRIVGRSVPRLDIPEKIDGRAQFGIDVFLPGMVYAKVAYPPTREGARLLSVDLGAARRVKGHLGTIVTDGLIAVVAETYEAAVAARDALRITWDPGPNASVTTASIIQEYERKAREERPEPWLTRGDVDAEMRRASRTHTATYTTDFVDQAPLEPMTCVARHENGVYDFFTGTQAQTRTVQDLSRKLGVDPAKIRIHQQYLGGGFGRRLEWDVLLEAAIIARDAGRPVKLIRSREEDFARAFPRSATLQVLRAGLDAGGTITAWEHTIVGAWHAAGFVDNQGRTVSAFAGSDHAYEIPAQRVRPIRGEHGIPAGAYRSVGPGYTNFAVETFVDELASLVKTDPLQLRLAMVRGQPRLVNVIRLAAARAGWGAPLPPNGGRGLACVRYALLKVPPTWMAAVVQVRVDPASGAVSVQRITCAADCGIVVNPDGLRAQVEGGLLFGLGTALKERQTVTGGALDRKNFEDYPLLRMDEVPEVDVHIVASAEPPGGAGEPPVTVVAPALANAIFAATGARVRHLPFLPDRVLAALKSKT